MSRVSHNSLWNRTFGSTKDLPRAPRRGEEQSGRRNVAGGTNGLPQGVARGCSDEGRLHEMAEQTPHKEGRGGEGF